MMEAPMETRQDTMSDEMQMQDGDDFVCPTCACEIRLVHHGDPARMPRMQPFTCCCGTPMQKEHPGN
jgi:hypothetical protein